MCIRGISRYFNTVRPSSGKWRNEVSESPSSSDGPARALWCARCRQYMSLSQEPKRVFCLFFSSLFFDARGILHFIFIFFFIVTFLLFALSANSYRDGSCARRMKKDCKGGGGRIDSERGGFWLVRGVGVDGFGNCGAARRLRTMASLPLVLYLLGIVFFFLEGEETERETQLA